ncbi:activating transcription factor 3 [Bactrocera oleae]|uniref:activating transcription factor 3 n=1 Tax=Bactrocera oleae TaxID=104688 RepID=UPI0006B862E4|nr:activating transcription factor 3 [Bactrocera oleae]
MFNLNTPSSLLGIDCSGLSTTPKTPEILNSLIAMTNPMDNYSFAPLNNDSAASTPGSAVSMRSFNGTSNAQIISQDSSHSSSSTSPADSPSGINTTPSVQQTCSQLIKAGLKLSIQSKRKLSTCDSSSSSDQPNSKYSRPDEDGEESTDEEIECKTSSKGLTPEDEDRRRRRRERNKIAATKCRMKKRERTQNLIKESEQLETQNVDLKTQVRSLEVERRKLLDMLQGHSTTCIHAGGLNLPSKLLHSPAHKYLTAIDMDDNSTANGDMSTANATVNRIQSQTQQQVQVNNTFSNQSTHGAQRTVIPPMSTIKFPRSAAAVAAAVNQQLHQLPTQQQHLPNGYCKPSPTPQELGYITSPSQENICLPANLPKLSSQSSATPQIGTATVVSSINQQLSDYIPNCENSLGLILAHTPTSVQSNDDGSVLLGDIVSPLSVMPTPTTATEFVKNELVDSQSPYTTAQSAERFLFESNCDSYVDIKHAVSLHHGSLNNNNNNNNSITALHQSSNNNLMDFNTSLVGGSSGIVPFHDQISIKNDYLHDADLLAQLTGDGAEFVDLDSSVAATFMTNNGCLA